MIKFLEQSQTKLIFECYPIKTWINLLIMFTVFTLCLYFTVFISPIDSKLICHKTVLNRVDCQLQESSLLNSNLTQTTIKNVRKAELVFFRKSNQIALITSSNFLFMNIPNLKKKYFYPSNMLALTNFSIRFSRQNSIREINKFLEIYSQDKTLIIEQSLNLTEFIISIFFAIFIPLFSVISIIQSFMTSPIKTIYQFDGDNKIMNISQKKIIVQDVSQEYSFDRINYIRLDKDDTKNIINCRIILQFNPDYDYPIYEFIDIEKAENVLIIIQSFLEQYE